MNPTDTPDYDPATLWPELFGWFEKFLTQVATLDPKGPNAAEDGAKHLRIAQASPNSDWATYNLLMALSSVGGMANWNFNPVNLSALDVLYNPLGTRIGTIIPSPELDASLRDWQKSVGVEPDDYPGEAPLTRL